jgi:hypothetical protein
LWLLCDGRRVAGTQESGTGRAARNEFKTIHCGEIILALGLCIKTWMNLSDGQSNAGGCGRGGRRGRVRTSLWLRGNCGSCLAPGGVIRLYAVCLSLYHELAGGQRCVENGR